MSYRLSVPIQQPERSLIPPEFSIRSIGCCKSCGEEIAADETYFTIDSYDYYCTKCVRPEASIDDYTVVFAICPECGEKLRTDEEFALVGGKPYCQDCVERIRPC